MRGDIAITEEMVNHNLMGWNVFDFLKQHIRKFTESKKAGWYAYIKKDGIYYFKWADNGRGISDKHLRRLKEDGYTIGITATTIQDAF